MAGYTPRNKGNKSADRTGATVSRKLRAAGWNISPAARRYRYDGMFVSAQGDHVSVLVDLGLEARNTRTAENMSRELLDMGFASDIRVTHSADTGSSFVHFTYAP